MRLEQTPAYLAFDALSHNLSPYDLNPFNLNPLRDPLIKLVDSIVCMRSRISS